MTASTANVVHLDLASGLADLTEARSSPLDVFLVLWWRGVPLGHIDLPPDALGRTDDAIATEIARTVAPAAAAYLAEEGTAPTAPGEAGGPWSVPGLDDLDRAPVAQPPEAPLDVSVIVCTRSRPDQLARCLDSIARSARSPRELIVVDNAPGDEATRRVVSAHPSIRYVPQPRKGLSVARNSGVRVARGEVIAFTDDDTEVHEDWTWRIARPFSRPEVAATTGLVLPADLSEPAQALFERGFGGFSQGYLAKEFDARLFTSSDRRAVPVWKIGAGANMAVRRSWFGRVGLFDERLGAGATGCSEDSELWFRLLAEGGVCRYEPSAVVHHHHRGDVASLRTLAHDYVRGHVAALLVEYARERRIGELRRVVVDMPKHLIREGARTALGRGSRWGMYRPGLTGYLRGAARIDLALDRRPPPTLES